jgi:hypothetical protein
VAIVAAIVLLVIGLLLAVVAYQAARAARAEAVAARLAAAQAAAQQAAAVASMVPSRFTIVERSTMPLPGMKPVLAHIDDIRADQVVLTLTYLRKQLFPPATMRQGDDRQFTIGTTAFVIELVELKHVERADDVAVFELRVAGAAPSTSPSNEP